MTGRLSRRRWGAVLLLLLLLGLGLLWQTQRPPAAETRRPAPRPAPVITQVITLQSQQRQLEAVGTARARRAVILFPQAAGEVVEVLFQGGERLQAGQALLRLDARRETLALAQAQLQLRDAEQRMARYAPLAGSGAIPDTELDQLRIALEGARLAVKAAEVELADRSVKAPFDGVVGFTEVDPGDRIDTATEIASFDDRSELLLDFTVPEAFAAALAPGHPIQAQPWALAGPPVRGVIEHMGARVDPERRQISVRARLPNPEDRLRPGMGFRVSLALRDRPRPVLPEAAVVWGERGSFLWQVREGRAFRVPATIVERRDGQVLVDAALAPGDVVVVEGTQRLREGQPVREAQAAPEPSR